MQLLREFPKDLGSLKRAQVLCFYMGRPDFSLALVQQVHFCPCNELNQSEEWYFFNLSFVTWPYCNIE